MKRLLKFSFAAAVLAASVTPAFADVTLYTQGDGNVFSTFSSQIDSSDATNNEILYDNFSLSGGANIKNVYWDGGRTRSIPVTGFYINIYANSGQNDPGGLLYSTYIPGNNSEINLFNVGDFGINFYQASVDFQVPAGSYWLAITGLVPSSPGPNSGTYGWAITNVNTGGDGVSYSDLHGTRQKVLVDYTFALTGTLDPVVPPPTAVTPEPSGLIMMGTGLLGFAGAVRRRLARS